MILLYKHQKVPNVLDGGCLARLGDISTLGSHHQAPYADGEMVIKLPQDDHVIGLALDLMRGKLIEVAGRSGQSRMGLDVKVRDQGAIQFDRSTRRMIIPVEVSSLSTIPNVLGILQNIVAYDSRFEIGRLLLREPNSALSKNQVEEAIRENMLWFPNDAEIKEGDQEAVIEVPL